MSKQTYQAGRRSSKRVFARARKMANESGQTIYIHRRSDSRGGYFVSTERLTGRFVAFMSVNPDFGS